LGISGWEISILYCTDNYIQQLNKRYRNRDEPTDVLSFGGGELFPGKPQKTIAGDIAVSTDSLKKNCREFGVSPNEELKRLLVHGILHLKGYDHEGNLPESSRENGEIRPEEEMLVLQERILQIFRTSIIIEERDGSI
jgi:probable rRNA maturation factor